MIKKIRNKVIIIFKPRKGPEFLHWYFKDEWHLYSINGKKIEKYRYVDPKNIPMNKECVLYENYAEHPWDIKGSFSKDKNGKTIFKVSQFGNYPKLDKIKIFTVCKVREEIYSIKESLL